jgi:hypothetical protein
MASARIDDRSSLARIYPREAYERDAGANSRAKASVLKGVRILSEVDAAGVFEMTPASQHVGEGDPEGDTVFLAPQFTDEFAALRQDPAAYGGAEEQRDAQAKIRPRGDYEAFLDRIIEAARRADFKQPIGRREERLRGFRGG